MQILGILSMYFDAVVVKYEKKLLLFKYILWQWICYLTCELIHNSRGKCLPIPGKRLLISRKCQISSKITRQCTTQKRMLLQIVCLHYSVITVTVNFSWPVKQDNQQQYIFFQGQGPHLSESDFLFEMSAAHLHHHIVVAKLICHFYSSRGCNVW